MTHSDKCPEEKRGLASVTAGPAGQNLGMARGRSPSLLASSSGCVSEWPHPSPPASLLPSLPASPGEMSLLGAGSLTPASADRHQPPSVTGDGASGVGLPNCLMYFD